MASKDVLFYREQAGRCRGIARLTQELGRQLTDMALEYDQRAEEADSPGDAGTREDQSSPHPIPAKKIEPLTLSIKDASGLLGLGRTTIYRLIGDQDLETVKIGNRTLIKTESIKRLLERGN